MEMRCKERITLEQKVIDAIRRVYATTGTERDRARHDERDAVRALNDHIRNHGCKLDA